MRQRITFLQEPENSLDPKLLEVATNSISTKELKAAREDRVTFPLEALPQELRLVLKASHELHIRWSSSRNYETIAPLNSRVSPGLHVFYTAQQNSHSSAQLCPILKKVFGELLDCLSPEQSFTSLPVERFSQSTATQYYQSLSDLTHLVEYLNHKVCQKSQSECITRVTALLTASSADIDFDTISHALTITAFWSPQIQSIQIDQKTNHKDRLEVGVLSVESPKEPEELSLGGFLTVVGEDTKPSPTLFSFPARHHPIQFAFSSSFIHPTGLHPTLQLEISGSAPPTDERSCSLHAHLTLPRFIFADRYQLSDPLNLASKNLSALHYTTTPVDLEAPSYTMSVWGSSLLLELAPPDPDSPSAFTAQIPLHLRYLPPASSGQSKLEVPYPVLFWACVADEGSKFPINPFDRVNLGYDGLFGPKTMFYHLSPAEGSLVNEISVPVLDSDKSGYVELGTAGVVLLGFAWVMWSLWGVWKREGYGNGRRKVREKKKL